MERRAELGRLASQQGNAMKAIQELEEERKKIVGERQPLGDLKQIAKDMQEVMSDLQSGSLSSETRLRQERILSRLLDASRSMTERDYEKSRESNSGKDVQRTSPADFAPPTSKQQQNRTLLDQLKMGYTRDYESIIRQYYEALQRQRIGSGVTK
jgi:O6-methylguanine-DNA--protein-cysteine methyltransferase